MNETKILVLAETSVFWKLALALEIELAKRSAAATVKLVV